MTQQATVEARMLGGFSLLDNGREIVPPRGSKSISILQYLITNRKQSVPAEALERAVWPDRSLDPHSSALRVAIHGLRKSLGSSLAVERIDGEGYRLGAQLGRVDIDDLDRLLQAGEVAADQDRKREFLSQAAQAYEGEFLPSEIYPWVEEARQWYRRRMVGALEWLREDAMNRKDATQTLHWATHLLRLDPWNESSYRALMNVHHRRGEVGQVRNWFDLCRQQLRGLDVALDNDTIRLFRELLSDHGSSSRRPAAPAPVHR